MTVAHLLNRTLEVWRASTVADAGGGQVTTFVQVGTVRGRVSQPSAAERQVAQQAGAELTDQVYMGPGADVRRGDQLRGDGDVFEVIDTVIPSEPVYLRADCELHQTAD